MKAVILAGGRGSRLTDLTKNKNKSMLEVFGKPVIEYNLDQAIEAGVKEIVIVVGYKPNEIKNHIGREYRGIAVSYVIQKKQKGLVHAIESAKQVIGDSDFILMLADEIVIDAKMKEMIKIFRKEGLFGICGIIFEKDKGSIGKTYSAMVNSKGRIFRLIEKPRFPINNIKGSGHCIFKNDILKYIDKTPISMKRGEKELVDMIQEAVDEGKRIRVFPLSKNYVNINTEEDLESARTLIKDSNPRVLIVHPQMKYFGGAELLIVELANWLTKRGIKNDILTASKSKKVDELLINTEIIIPKNDIQINPTGFKDINEILKFIKIFKRQLNKIKKNYDVINMHNFPATWTLFPKKNPCVWMLNEPPSLWSRPNAGFLLKSLNKLRYWLDRYIVKNSIDIICVADEFNKKRCLKRYKKDPRIIYYGVNYDFFSKGRKEKAIKRYNLNKKFVVVQSGMLTEAKNQLTSVKAINKIREKIPNILLVLAGKSDQEYKKKIEEYIKKNKIENHVLFTDNLTREDLRDLYKAANVGLFPVGKQGGWLAPFELLCSGNPIIVSKEMGASSVIEQFNLGIVEENYDKALLEIHNNQQYAKNAKKAALFIKKNFGWDVFTDKLCRAYKDAWKKNKN